MHQDIDHEAFAMDSARERVVHEVVEPGAFAAVRAGLTLGGHGVLGHVREGGNFTWMSDRVIDDGNNIRDRISDTSGLCGITYRLHPITSQYVAALRR